MSYNPSAFITNDQIVILDTTNASSTNASLYVQGGLSTHDTFVDGHVMINNVKITPNLNDIIFEQESVLSNNVSEWTIIPNFEFDSSITTTFKAHVNITVSTGIPKYAYWEINGLFKSPGGWVLTSSFTGDLTGVNFNISSDNGIGKIQYTNSNNSGTTTIRYRATTTAQPGSTPLGAASGIIENLSGPFIANRFIYANTNKTLASTDLTYNANSFVIGGTSRLVLQNANAFEDFSAGGSLTSMGDASIAHKLIVGERIGINTTAPVDALDINGKLNINDNINFSNNKILLTGSVGINTTSQHTNSIVLNASNDSVSTSTSGSFYVKPIRNLQASNVLNYNSSSNEIVYKPHVYAQFYSNETQNLTQDTVTAIVHQNAGESNGITITGTPQTKFQFSQTGIYKFGTSILFSESGGSATSVRFWFKKGGFNIPESASVVYVPGNNTLTLGYAEIIVNIQNIITDYLEIYAFTTSNNISVAYSNSSIDYPGAPGVITTIYQLD